MPIRLLADDTEKWQLARVALIGVDSEPGVYEDETSYTHESEKAQPECSRSFVHENLVG